MSRRPATQDKQRGSVTLEMVIIFPALLIMLFAAVQTGLWFHARNIAMTAAQEGARAAAAYNSSSSEGSSVAASYAIEAGGRSPQVSVTRTSTLTTVTVTLDGFTLIPGVLPQLTIEQSATMPLERVS